MPNQDFSQMAHFIAQMRKEQNLTQKELAETLGVTDKAVSKWERGLSCPDISLLLDLSAVLGVTASELLNGAKADSPSPEAEAVIKTTLEYAAVSQKTESGRALGRQFLADAWKQLPVACLIIFSCAIAFNILFTKRAADTGLSILEFAIPTGLAFVLWLAAAFAAFVRGKNKIATLLLCDLSFLVMAFCYASLNEAPVRDFSNFAAEGFVSVYLPYYSVILGLLAVALVLLAITVFVQKKNIDGNRLFAIAAAAVTIIAMALLTVASIVEYVDLNGYGVNGNYTVLLLLAVLGAGVSLALAVKKSIKIRH
jgi:transcriptional regulator with XRE-family HTH domain